MQGIVEAWDCMLRLNLRIVHGQWVFESLDSIIYTVTFPRLLLAKIYVQPALVLRRYLWEVTLAELRVEALGRCMVNEIALKVTTCLHAEVESGRLILLQFFRL